VLLSRIMSDDVPPLEPLPVAGEMKIELKVLSSLIRAALEEHEKRELGAIEKMSRMVDALIHDARGLHLQAAAHGNSIAQLEVELGSIKERLARLEAELDELKRT
jgi:ABC-type phosphate transport system auxiliary subunit